MKYSDLIAEILKSKKYTHCFFVAGGNIMHLLESFSKTLECIPVAHEVAAGIATEYFNQTSKDGYKALALVTAGPGLTNIITAMAGAYLESRELLVIGGQVKTSDLSKGTLRQRGIQEIDGVSLAKPVSVISKLFDQVIEPTELNNMIDFKENGRSGPVFFEIPLDIQARNVDFQLKNIFSVGSQISSVSNEEIDYLDNALINSKRPVLLLGGGVNHSAAEVILERARALNLPLFTTWNGLDRVPADHPCYFGRPNTWGQRYSNLLIQQADLIIAAGTRLGLQQTGFNWQEFGANAKVIQIDCDENELKKGHPNISKGICADCNPLLIELLEGVSNDWSDWKNYCSSVKNKLPLIEKNNSGSDFISPHDFVAYLSKISKNTDIVIPCSSGSAFTVMMQVFEQKKGQRLVTNKGLASMGYGLSGAIGAAIANPDKRTILVEGDGGFFQNIQEIGTGAVNKLNLKIFIFDDGGYASIRMTQKSYFGGKYVGCDKNTKLGLPNWEKLFSAFDVPVIRLHPEFEKNNEFHSLFEEKGIAAFIVSIDPEQTYFPKITSRVTDEGMVSNPLHNMTPELDPILLSEVGKYLL